MIKALIFDYGGTLDTDGRHWFPVLWEAYSRAGAPFGREIFRDAYIYGERMLEARRIIDAADDFRETLVKKCRLHLEYCLINNLIGPDEFGYAKLVEAVAADCDGSARRGTSEARRILELLAERYPMAVIANFYGNLDRVLKVYGLDGLFSHVIDSTIVGIRKPDPSIFSLAIEKIGLDPGEIAVVGDSFENDIAPARGLGCEVFWLGGVGWNPGAEQRSQVVPEDVKIIASLKEFPDALG
jgi:FMN phosphatase YigB (HAD superfamily)